MSAPAAALFLLMLISGGGPVSLTQLAAFPTRAACMTARDTVRQAIGPQRNQVLACVSEASLGDLEQANK